MILALLMIPLALALDVKIYNDEGFEIDVFEIGDNATIKVVSNTIPKIIINGENMSEMKQIGEKYEYLFEADRQGTYDIIVKSGNKTKTAQLFVTGELELEAWEKENETKGKLENQNVYKQESQNLNNINFVENKDKKSLLNRAIDFFKKSWVIAYG